MEGNAHSISSLPVEIIKRICDYLQFSDLLKACDTIPGWDYVLSLPRYEPTFNAYLSNIQWLDEYMCWCLSEGSGTTRTLYLYKAAVHYASSSSSFPSSSSSSSSSFSSTGFCSNSIASIDPSRFRNPYLPTYLIWDENTAIAAMNNWELCIMKERLNILKACNSLYLVGTYFTIYPNVIIYAFSGPGHSETQFQQLLRSLRSHQVLLILQIKVGLARTTSNLQCLIRTFKQFARQLRGVTCLTWRIWYVDFQGFEFINLSDALNWAYEESCKHISSSYPEFGPSPYKLF